MRLCETRIGDGCHAWYDLEAREVINKAMQTSGIVHRDKLSYTFETWPRAFAALATARRIRPDVRWFLSNETGSWVLTHEPGTWIGTALN